MLSFLAFAATVAGGLLVLRFQKLPGELFAFSAGTLLAIAGLDLLPQSFERGGVLALAAAVLGYGALYWWHGLAHRSSEPGYGGVNPGLIGAVVLVVHKFLDGLALGLGLSGSAVIGIGVTLAIVLHSFCDGINTVTLVMRAQADRRLAILFLAATALAPLIAALGIARLALSPLALAWLLAFLAGTFLFVALHDLLPAAHHACRHRSPSLRLSASLGAGILLTWVFIGVLSV
ncbi:MAG: ZIP family metal transporter [Gemmatimonadaceae bacterium]|nr:ZIP family metal transporter [Gloeobacterales cyanobacterium ES-bin-141]